MEQSLVKGFYQDLYWDDFTNFLELLPGSGLYPAFELLTQSKEFHLHPFEIKLRRRIFGGGGLQAAQGSFSIKTSLLMLGLFDGLVASAAPVYSQNTVPPPAAAPSPDPVFVPPRVIPSSAMTNWPVYSAAARQAHRVGIVLLSVKISADGMPLDVKVARSSNFIDLDVAAALAVRKWKFTPAMLNGAPSETTVNLPIHFSLKTAEKTPELPATPPAAAPKSDSTKPKPKAEKKITAKPKSAASQGNNDVPANAPGASSIPNLNRQ